MVVGERYRRWTNRTAAMAQHSQSLRQHLIAIQIPETCLVTGRRMVCTASELESQHCGDGAGCLWDHSYCVEY